MNRVMSVVALVVALAGADRAAFAQAAGDADLVAAVRAAIAAQDLPRGEALVTEFRSSHGVTPEALDALSWLGRGAYAAGQLDAADRYARETYTLTVAALRSAKLDADSHLQTALGAAIETQALVGAARGARSEAVYLLRKEIETYRDTAIHKRLAKNLNLLSLEGQPAPPLEATEYLDRPVPSFAELRGKVVLLFFWAHWCPDCKAESPIIAKLLDRYRDQGLVVVAPTQRFGYVAGGRTAGPDEELRYIIQTRDTYYGFLRNQPVPVSVANHNQYGVSSTPTLALLDRDGIVRVYHPGRMTEAELDTAIRGLLAPARGAQE